MTGITAWGDTAPAQTPYQEMPPWVLPGEAWCALLQRKKQPRGGGEGGVPMKVDL